MKEVHETGNEQRQAGWKWPALGLSLLLLLLTAILVPLCLPPLRLSVQTAHHVGSTNGVTGPLVPTFRTLSPEFAKTMDAWLASGTNVALFAFTNREVCGIWIFPFVTVAKVGESGARHSVPLLNPPDLNGIRLKPGEAVHLQIPILPTGAMQRVGIGYRLDSCSATYPAYQRYRDLPRDLGALLFGFPIHSSTHPIGAGDFRLESVQTNVSTLSGQMP